MPLETYGDIRRAVTADKLDWTVNPQFNDEALIVRRSLGAVTENLVKAVDVPPVDVAEKVRQFLPANPFLLNELLSIGVITELPVELKIGSEPHETLTPLVAGAPHGPKTVVDWRNRWGTSWVTGIRDQDPCEHCWTFAPVALVESMVRIEHSLWCIRSEGDVLGGNGHEMRPMRRSHERVELDGLEWSCGPWLLPMACSRQPDQHLFCAGAEHLRRRFHDCPGVHTD